MVQAMITLGEKQDRVLTIVKGKHGFKNKSDALNFLIDRYEETELEPELRPEYKNKINSIVAGKHISRKELDKRLNNVR